MAKLFEKSETKTLQNNVEFVTFLKVKPELFLKIKSEMKTALIGVTGTGENQNVTVQYNKAFQPDGDFIKKIIAENQNG